MEDKMQTNNKQITYYSNILLIIKLSRWKALKTF